MPSSITHQLVAEETLEKLPAAIRSIAAEAKDEYYLGCQGPDMLFFYRIGCRSEYNFGKFLHRYRVYDVFELLRRAISGGEGTPRFSENEKKRALGYVLGYITHYCTDSVFHPFVYNYLASTQAQKREHQQMENDWDVYFLRELRGRETEKFPFAFTRKGLKASGVSARLFAYLADKLEREEVTPRRFYRGVKNFERYLKFFHKKCYRSQKRWQRAEKIFHVKRYLSRLYPRTDPDPNYISCDHFAVLSDGNGNNADALFACAVEKSAEYILRFCDALKEGTPLPREDFCKSFLTGKPAE